MASRNATHEPLPLVPPTVKTRNVGCSSCMIFRTRLTRSRPRSMGLGCSCSCQRSQASSVEKRMLRRMKRFYVCLRVRRENAWYEMKKCIGCQFRICAAYTSALAFFGRRLACEHGEQRGEFVAHLATVHDHVHGPVFQQKLAALETFRQGFAYRLLDNPGTCEPDECLGFGHVHIPQHRQRSGHAAG